MMVRETKANISRTVCRWKYPKLLTSLAIPSRYGSASSPLYFKIAMHVTRMVTDFPQTEAHLHTSLNFRTARLVATHSCVDNRAKNTLRALLDIFDTTLSFV